MIDICKIRTFKQSEINRLLNWSQTNFKPYTNRYKKDYNYYLSYSNGSARFRLDFCKVFENGKLIGFSYVDVRFSPHYFFNKDLHNGNDLTPVQCIKTLNEIIDFLQISKDEVQGFKVVNLEYGLNIIPEIDIKNLINNLLYFGSAKIIVPDNKIPFFKKSNTTDRKVLKTYAKGLQFAEFPQYKINTNTLRLEIKSKKSAFIKKVGIYNINDLLNLQKYEVLFQSILDQWQKVLLINTTPDYSTLKTDEVQFVKSANKIEFWDDLKGEINRNKFTRYKVKYYKILQGKNNIHTKIKGQIIDKFSSWQSGAYFPQPTLINTQKDISAISTATLIKGKSAPPLQNHRICLVTKLDISMQKKTSKYLCSTGLKWYYKNDFETYQRLKGKYLTENKKDIDLDVQIYYLSHNIRNYKTNPDHNPKYSRQRFEQRNYHPDQLQFFN